jgi:hypothetical protein
MVPFAEITKGLLSAYKQAVKQRRKFLCRRTALHLCSIKNEEAEFDAVRPRYEDNEGRTPAGHIDERQHNIGSFSS